MLVVRFLLLLSFKSMLHVCNIECIPGQDDILIEGRGTTEHVIHVCHFGCIPGPARFMGRSPCSYDNHKNTYRTKRVVLSRDVRWLDQNYTSYKKSQGLWDNEDEDDPDEDSLGEFDEDVSTTQNIEEPTNIDAITDMAPPLRDHAVETQVTWADMVRRPATRSATKAGRATLEPIEPIPRNEPKKNAALIREMARLSGPGSYRNPTAETVLEEAKQQEESNESKFKSNESKQQEESIME